MTIVLVILALVAVAATIYGVSADRRAAAARAEAEMTRRLLEERAADSVRAEDRFRALAAEALMENTQRLDATNRESIHRALEPMAERMRELEKSVRDTYTAEARERFSLQDRVRELVDLNRVIGAETRRLTDALKGNTRVQGDWGEIILENILERSGLKAGREYEVQKGIETPDGQRLRPDVVINYPDGRCVVVDSKVSVSAYLAMVDAADPAAQAAAAKAHVASVRAHINELKAKNYQDATGERHCDFVMMFVPHEGAYMAAMQLDPALWQYAFDSRVLIVSPTHLMAVVKLVEQLWRNDRQSRNAIEIATEAGRMLDKLCGFLTDLEKINSALNSARKAWDDAHNKLTAGTGNLLGRAERLRRMGAKATKDLPPTFRPESEE